MTSSLEKWRTKHEEEFLVGEALEAEAKRLALPEGFEIATTGSLLWWEYGWNHDGKSLERFKQMITTAAIALGPPDRIGESSSAYTLIPDLQANWTKKYELDGPMKGETFHIVVWISNPAGCKVDPRHPYVEGQSPKLHPECRDVLEALEAQL